MRVEPAPHVFRNEDRRARAEERRGTGEDRRTDTDRNAGSDRNRMNARPWFEPVFGAHLLGQIEKPRISRETAHRAYLQPESRTPLRPDHETRA